MRGPRFEQFAMIAQAAVAGLGAGLVPRFLVSDELETGRLEMPFPHPLENGCGYYLVCPEEKAEASQVRFFRDWIVRETAEARAGKD